MIKEEVMINPCFLPFQVYQVSSGLKREGLLWEIQAGKARYAALTSFFKSNIRLVCRWLSWMQYKMWLEGNSNKNNRRDMYFTTGWKNLHQQATGNISWHKYARHRISLIYKEICWNMGRKQSGNSKNKHTILP